MMVAKITLVLWPSSVLKRHDAVLVKISSNVTCNYKMEMCDAPIFHSTELCSLDLILKAA